MTRTGISMRLLNTNRGLQYFAFEHSKDYQGAQFQFLNAVESHDPNNIGEVLNMQPYHLDALIQLSDVFKMSEDMQMAADLIERALYCCECAFHPLFSLTQGNCRLDYRRPENRSFYIALFKHTLFVGNRGCYRTALEFSKLLLSLDPEDDPLCILLMIDYYALKSAQYEFLIRMYNEWEAHRNLSQLPNFAFSVPLAKFYLACQLDEDKREADNMLQDSLLHFPVMLPLLLDKCNIKPDKVVLEHEFFGPRAESSHPEQLRELMNLYVTRCHGLWKEPAVMTWLENNVHKVLHRVDHNDERMLEYKEKRQSRYRGTPQNVLRHIVLSELPGVTAALPRDAANLPFMSYDPLPPADNIASYDRPVQPRRPEQNYGSFSMFFRSLLPNFNAQDLENANRVDELAGAVGGGGLQEHPELRQGFGNLMNALRDLIGQIQPVPPPVENVEDEVDEEDWQD